MTGFIATLNPTGKGIFSAGGVPSSTSNTTLFIPLGEAGAAINSSTTETVADYTIQFTIIVKRVQAVVSVNTKSAATTLAFRDDGVSVGALTVDAATTGEFDSGALNVRVASGSKICFLRDTAASVSGAISMIIYVEYETAG